MTTQALAAAALLCALLAPAEGPTQDAPRDERLRALLAALRVRETFESSQAQGFRSSLDALPMLSEPQRQELLARCAEIVAEQLPWERVEADHLALYDEVFDDATLQQVLGLTADPRYALLADKQLALLGPATVLGNTYAQELLPFVMRAFSEVLEDEPPQNPHEMPGAESDLLMESEPAEEPPAAPAVPALDAGGVPVAHDPENVVASALPGRWSNDVPLTKRLQGISGELLPRTLAFRVDASVATRVPDGLARHLAGTPVLLAGWMEQGGQEYPFLLTTASGNSQLAWFHGPPDDPFAAGDSFNLSLARGVTPAADLLLVGGDFNDQAFEAFSRVE